MVTQEHEGMAQWLIDAADAWFPLDLSGSAVATGFSLI